VIGIEKGFEEAHKGAHIRIPNIFRFIIKWVSPAYLLIIFALWVLTSVFGYSFETGEFVRTGYVADLLGESDPASSHVARLCFALISIVVVFTLVLIAAASGRWKKKITNIKVN